MWEELLTSLHILFGFVSSQLWFVGAFWSFYVCANSDHLTNLANVDGWLLKLGIVGLCTCLRPSCASIPSFIFPPFGFLRSWYMGRVWILVVISHILLGALSTHRREVTSIRGVRMCETNYDWRYLVLVRLLVTKHFCNVFEVQIVLICWCLY